MTKNRIIRARIDDRHGEWIDREKTRTGEGEAVILRRLIVDQINQCNDQTIKWCPEINKETKIEK